MQITMGSTRRSREPAALEVPEAKMIPSNVRARRAPMASLAALAGNTTGIESSGQRKGQVEVSDRTGTTTDRRALAVDLQ